MKANSMNIDKELDEILKEVINAFSNASAGYKVIGIEEEVVEAKKEIKQLFQELVDGVIGHDLEYRETDDMSLSSWTNEDYKACGRNELRNDIRQRAKELLNKEN